MPVLHASFTFLLLIAGLIIGLYGAVAISAKTGPEFIGQLILEQHAILGAITLIGILAAAMSTSDSQFFALGSEINNVFSKYSKELKISPVIFVKGVILILCVASFIVAMKSPQELISLAINGFMGTALMAPMILVSILYNKIKFSSVIPIFTAASLVIFLMSLFGVLPNMILGIRMDLILLSINTIATVITLLIRAKTQHKSFVPKI